MISDATERVHEAERRYRTLVEALPVVTLISAPNDRSSVSYVSPQVEQLLGYSPAEWQDDPELFGKLLHPDDKDEVLARAKRKSSDAAPRKTEYRLLARGGGVVWVTKRSRPFAAPKGKPLYTQTLLIDIGERKRADEERERLLAAEREATARTVERQRRLDFVREAGQVLASSSDYRSAIQRVAELAVRDYSDWCVVDVVEDGGPLERVAVARAELLSKKAAARAGSGARGSGAPSRRDRRPRDRSCRSARRRTAARRARFSAASTRARRSASRSEPASGRSER